MQGAVPGDQYLGLVFTNTATFFSWYLGSNTTPAPGIRVQIPLKPQVFRQYSRIPWYSRQSLNEGLGATGAAAAGAASALAGGGDGGGMARGLGGGGGGLGG